VVKLGIKRGFNLSLGLRLEDPGVVTLGCSEYLQRIHDTAAGLPPLVDFDLERRVQAACRQGIRQGCVQLTIALRVD